MCSFGQGSVLSRNSGKERQELRQIDKVFHRAAAVLSDRDRRFAQLLERPDSGRCSGTVA
jgi:hypothetical protein